MTMKSCNALTGSLQVEEKLPSRQMRKFHIVLCLTLSPCHQEYEIGRRSKRPIISQKATHTNNSHLDTISRHLLPARRHTTRQRYRITSRNDQHGRLDHFLQLHPEPLPLGLRLLFGCSTVVSSLLVVSSSSNSSLIDDGRSVLLAFFTLLDWPDLSRDQRLKKDHAQV
jgi:hypothetical protein